MEEATIFISAGFGCVCVEVTVAPRRPALGSLVFVHLLVTGLGCLSRGNPSLSHSPRAPRLLLQETLSHLPPGHLVYFLLSLIPG